MKRIAIVVSALMLAVFTAACSSDTMESAQASPMRVDASEFASVIAETGTQIIDVRTPEEFAEGHIQGAVNIPVESSDFLDAVADLDPDATYAVYCRSGNRSQGAVASMASAGITEIYELESGTVGWTGEGLPLVQ